VLFAAFVAIVAVGLGLGLGLAPGRARLAGPLRTFALSAALTVVVLHLLPEAFGELGVTALLLFAATSVFSAWQRLARVFMGKGHDDGDGHVHSGLVAGYVGLLIHHVGDGLGLGAYASLPGGATAHADVMLALGAHTVPLVAVVAFAFRRTGGSRGALKAAAGLAGASLLGVALSGFAPSDAVEHYSAWIAALVAGLLVHVVTHDLGTDLPTNVGGRALDAVAAILGVVACVAGGVQAMGGHAEPVVTAFLDVTVILSLPVLVGAVLVAAVLGSKPGPIRRAAENAFGRSLGIDGLVVALWIDGWAQGALLFVGGVAVAAALGAFSKRFPEVEEKKAENIAPFLIRLDDFLGSSLAWIATALGLAAVILSSLPGLALSLSTPVAVLLAAAVALPARLPAGPAFVIVFALERQGLPQPAALVFALLAPAPGALELARFARRASARSALRMTGALVGVALVFGIVSAAGRNVIVPLIAPLFPNFKLRAAALVLAALALREVFSRGLRGALLEVFPSHDTASHTRPEGSADSHSSNDSHESHPSHDSHDSHDSPSPPAVDSPTPSNAS
jgi:hypothetical protein